MYFKFLVPLFFTFLTFSAISQEGPIVENIASFSKVYGYVKYFHPSDESASIDWDDFAIYGAELVAKCQNQFELKQKLLELFSPIAPTLQITEVSEELVFDENIINPPNRESYKVVSWQHLGLGLESAMPKKNNPYKSQRLNRWHSDDNSQRVKLFEEYAEPGDYFIDEIGKGLKCLVPISLYGNEKTTFPKIPNYKYENFKSQIDTQNSKSSDLEMFTHIGAIIKCWNIFQHFYPYQDVVEGSWEKKLFQAIKEALEAKDSYEYLWILRKMTASLNDGHLTVYSNIHRDKSSHFPPIKWEWVEGQLMITDVYEDQISSIRYSLVKEIDGEKSSDFFVKRGIFVSAGNESSKQNKIENFYSLFGPENSIIKLLISDGQGQQRVIELNRSIPNLDYFAKIKTVNNLDVKKLASSIYYVNLMNVEIEKIREMLPKFKKAKGLIFDSRGYPKGENYEIIQYLLNQPDTSKNWLNIPKIIFPNYQKVADYESSGWSLNNLKPHINCEIVFLTDANAISFAESILSFVKHYNLATIMGQITAGANGNVNAFTLPGGYRVSWTGSRVTHHNGNVFRGIEPDIAIENTISGIQSEQDEFLQKALQFIVNKH